MPDPQISQVLTQNSFGNFGSAQSSAHSSASTPAQGQIGQNLFALPTTQTFFSFGTGPATSTSSTKAPRSVGITDTRSCPMVTDDNDSGDNNTPIYGFTTREQDTGMHGTTLYTQAFGGVSPAPAPAVRTLSSTSSLSFGF